MSPLPGKQTSPELERWLQEARAGSAEGYRKALAVCRECLVELAAEELPAAPGREGQAEELADAAFREVPGLLRTFAGSSESELRAWLRELLQEQTRPLPGQRRHVDSDHGDLSTPHPGAASAPETHASAPPGAPLAPAPDAAAAQRDRPRLDEDATLSAPKTTLDRDGTLPAEDDDRPPSARFKLDGFDIEEQIGRGGMGLVYRAWQKHLQRWVALKCLPPDFAADPERLRRFRQEARLAAQLTEHGILQVYDVLEAGDTPILVLPYIEGSDLAKIILQRRMLRDGKEVRDPHPWATLGDADYLARILPFFDKVLDALVRLHGAGVLHRDLKPSNILVDKNGNGWLADFGLARFSQSETMTQAPKTMGTPGFMSPEQWDGDEDIDERTDVFGMGATLYQALTLQLPYGKGRLTATTPPAQFARRQRRLLPANMDLVLLRALQPDHLRRYQSAADLKDDWQWVRQGALPQKAPIGPGRRLANLARRRSSQIVAALALLLVVVLAAVLLTPPAKVVRTVHVVTEPSGARVALVPLNTKDGMPQFEKAIQPKGRTPVAVPDVPPGEYLVIVEVENHGFHEVFRHVPEPAENAPTKPAPGVFPQPDFDERADKSIDLRSITVPKYDARDGMAYFGGGDFVMGDPVRGHLIGIPAHKRAVEPFYLDETEVTIAAYRKLRKTIPPDLSKLSPKDEEPMRFVTFDEAAYYAELLGKRLPDEAEYEFAATNAGKSWFPWGDDAERITAWKLGQVGQPDYDRASAEPKVCGLFSNVAEWTTSWLAPYPGAEWPSDLKLAHGERFDNQRIVRGGPWEVVKNGEQPKLNDPKVFNDARWRQGVSRDEALPGLGFRCARSAFARFPPTAGN
jgi:serine/threonine protein kinase/formylglycine-generating enzyme required for sulfatase activity